MWPLRDAIYKDRVYETHLLRRSYREEGKVQHETLGNLSYLPTDLIDVIRRRLQSGQPEVAGDFEILRSLPHGHVAVLLGLLRQLGLDRLLASRPSRERDLVVAMIVARILQPASKLATTRAVRKETCASSLNSELQLGPIEDRELYQALDWLLQRQGKIERRLAERHLQDGTLILYDVSSSYYTGQKCELVQHGYNRDGRRRFPQIVYGLICNAEGCPVAIEVFRSTPGMPPRCGPKSPSCANGSVCGRSSSWAIGD